MVDIATDQLWMVIVGFIIAFVLAFGIGGNDVANSFGTSYGAKVLTIRQICILASLFETLGAVLLGAKVSDTIRKGIIDIEPYRNDTSTLMVGNVAALSGSCIWLMAATVLRLPVSATHSIVGATIGFALVAHGLSGINWAKMGMIIGSWFISPVLAGVVSTGIFLLCKFFILNKEDPLEPGLRWLPVFYAATVVINLFSVFYDGPEMLHLDRIPLWGTFVLSFGSGIICALVVRFAVVPWQRRRIKDEVAKQSAETAETAAMTQPQPDACSKYEGPENCTPQNGDAVKFSFDSDNCSSGASSNSASQNASQDDIREPDEIDIEKAKIKTTMLELQNQNNSANDVDVENQKNIETQKNTSNTSFLSPPMPATGKVLSEITQPANNTAAPKAPGKPKINKSEDAPLMDNEYKLGACTPIRSPTSEDLQKNNVINGSAKGSDSKTVALSGEHQGSDLDQGRLAIKDRPETTKLFSFLQILTAVFGGFAHGGNDVSNAIGPLVSLWLIGSTGVVSAKASTPIWILLYGGAGISLGLWLWGIRVIKTMGEDLAKITPSSGFCIEIGTALTVLIASNIGIPISTTHCKVGSIVFVGRFRSRDNVDWSIFRNIVLAWLVTLPVTGGISAAIMAALQQAI